MRPWSDRGRREMLAELAKASDAAGFHARIPYALRVAKRAAQDLIARDVPAASLALTIQATRAVEEYSAETATKSALLQLRQAGTERRPGEFVEYVITRRDGARAGRARPVELLGQGSPWFGSTPAAYHVDAYLRLLARQVETILAPFGYEEDRLHAWLAGARRWPQETGGEGSSELQPSRQVHRGGANGGDARVALSSRLAVKRRGCGNMDAALLGALPGTLGGSPAGRSRGVREDAGSA